MSPFKIAFKTGLLQTGPVPLKSFLPPFSEFFLQQSWLVYNAAHHPKMKFIIHIFYILKMFYVQGWIGSEKAAVGIKNGEPTYT